MGACNAIDIQSSERSMYAYRGKEGGRGGGKGGRKSFVPIIRCATMTLNGWKIKNSF